MPDPAAEERRRAWRSSADPAVRDRNYAAVLRRQFGADGHPRRPADPEPEVLVDDEGWIVDEDGDPIMFDAPSPEDGGPPL